MQPAKRFLLQDLPDDLAIYFNWSANALMPFYPRGADEYLRQNRRTITIVSQELLGQIDYIPDLIFRGILLKDQVISVLPHKNLEYLSFSTERPIAEHFAKVDGFGSHLVNNATHLGKYGYVIEYVPSKNEVLFHHAFLSILPYSEAFSLLGMNGPSEVGGLKKQKEVIILQPPVPFTNITRI